MSEKFANWVTSVGPLSTIQWNTIAYHMIGRPAEVWTKVPVLPTRMSEKFANLVTSAGPLSTIP